MQSDASFISNTTALVAVICIIVGILCFVALFEAGKILKSKADEHEHVWAYLTVPLDADSRLELIPMRMHCTHKGCNVRRDMDFTRMVERTARNERKQRKFRTIRALNNEGETV